MDNPQKVKILFFIKNNINSFDPEFSSATYNYKLFPAQQSA
jgi:hypothetical protein